VASILGFHELTVGDQTLHGGPVFPGGSQKLVDGFSPHGVYGGDAQQVFFHILRGRKGVSLVADQKFDLIDFFEEDLESPVDDVLLRRTNPGFCRWAGGNAG